MARLFGAYGAPHLQGFLILREHQQQRDDAGCDQEDGKGAADGRHSHPSRLCNIDSCPAWPKGQLNVTVQTRLGETRRRAVMRYR
jgi:hypothetical protein